MRGDPMAVNKVIYGTTVLVDLSGDNVTADSLLTGHTAHGADGEPVTGTLLVATIYSGNSEPDSSIGVDGDIYIQL